MGGSSEKYIANLRVHINNEDIHFHDDAKNLKFKSNLEEFKTDIEGIFKALEQEEEEGIAEVQSTDTNLCIMKREGTYYLFIKDNNVSGDIKEELQNYLKAN